MNRITLESNPVAYSAILEKIAKVRSSSIRHRDHSPTALKLDLDPIWAAYDSQHPVFQRLCQTESDTE